MGPDDSDNARGLSPRQQKWFATARASLERETAEIFRGESAQELWQSVSHLREHHVRDLYRSLL